MTMLQGLEFGAEHVRFAASDHASKERLSHIENSHFFCKHGHHSNTIDYNSLLGWLCVCLLFFIFSYSLHFDCIYWYGMELLMYLTVCCGCAGCYSRWNSFALDTCRILFKFGCGSAGVSALAPACCACCFYFSKCNWNSCSRSISRKICL